MKLQEDISSDSFIWVIHLNYSIFSCAVVFSLSSCVSEGGLFFNGSWDPFSYSLYIPGPSFQIQKKGEGEQIFNLLQLHFNLEIKSHWEGGSEARDHSSIFMSLVHVPGSTEPSADTVTLLILWHRVLIHRQL